MRSRKRRAPRMMQRITGKEKKPGTGVETEMVPEEEKRISVFREGQKSYVLG